MSTFSNTVYSVVSTQNHLAKFDIDILNMRSFSSLWLWRQHNCRVFLIFSLEDASELYYAVSIKPGRFTLFCQQQTKSTKIPKSFLSNANLN